MFFVGAHFLQDFGPHGDADFSQMGFTEKQHEGAGLADSSADGERDFVFQDGLVIGELHEVELPRHGQLLFEGFGGDTNAHGGQFVAAVGDVVPDEDVAVESVGIFAGFVAGVGNPVVVIGGAHLVRVSIAQGPADADDEDGGIFLEDGGFALLAGKVGIHVEEFLGVEELQVGQRLG